MSSEDSSITHVPVENVVTEESCPMADYAVPTTEESEVGISEADEARHTPPNVDTASGGDSECADEDLDQTVDIEEPDKLPESSSEVVRAMEKRRQPILELVHSEEVYVTKLRVVNQLYMPAAYRSVGFSDSSSIASASKKSGDFEELANLLPPGGPSVPEDLVKRWRILWGNWLQLYDWHSNFLEKLKAFSEDEPDRIAKLFIESRARLRSIYSKYCENQIKAAHIAEQHKDFFDEWRIHINDKDDVLSHIMQPVQRIMRYQLPISEIVKWTQRALLPSLPQWERALDIMKEIPKDTQLILEAARIDGFPGVITALGTLRIRGNLLVTSLSRSDLSTVIGAYTRTISSSSGQAACGPSRACEGGSETSDLVAGAPQTAVRGSASPEQQGDANLDALSLGGHRCTLSRVFLFDRMLLITDEVKAKRKGTLADAFAQSSYNLRVAINVNKMSFRAQWFCCDPSMSQDSPSLDYDAPEDLRFAIWDQSPGQEVVYIIEPQDISAREAWIVHLRDIQHMQQQLLMALEEPTRFASGSDEKWGRLNSSMEAVLHPTVLESEKPTVPKKWPNFSLRRPARPACTAFSGQLASSKSTENRHEESPFGLPLTAERYGPSEPTMAPDSHTSKAEDSTLTSRPSDEKMCENEANDDQTSYTPPIDDLPLEQDVGQGYDVQKDSAGFFKKKNVFVNLFGKHSKRSQRQQPPLPRTAFPGQRKPLEGMSIVTCEKRDS